MRFFRSIAAATGLCLCTGMATAQGVPTHDPRSLAELIALLNSSKDELAQSIRTNGILDEQTQQLTHQLEELEEVVASLTEGFDLETLLAGLNLDDLLDGLGLGGLQEQLASARIGDWGSVFGSGTVGGVPAGEVIAGIYESAGLSQETVDSLTSSDNPNKQRVGNQAATNAFTSIAAENAIEQTSASLERTATLIGQIDDATNLKQAIDLNTRLTGELVIALVNQANMEAIQIVSMGQAGVIDAATMADDEKFLSLTGETSLAEDD
jgi:type IV secretion system protein VirB5